MISTYEFNDTGAKTSRHFPERLVCILHLIIPPLHADSKPPVFVMQASIRIQNSKFPCNRLQQLWQPLATFGVFQNGRRPHIMHARIPDFHAVEFVACSISFSIVHVGKSSISGCRLSDICSYTCSIYLPSEREGVATRRTALARKLFMLLYM